MVERKAFLLKPKYQWLLSQWGEYVYGAQSWKKRRLLRESVFALIDRWALTLKKMVGRKAFIMKPKHQCQLSQWGNWVYGSQSLKERRLFKNPCLSHCWINFTFMKNDGKSSFSYKTNASMSFVQISGMSL